MEDSSEPDLDTDAPPSAGYLPYQSIENDYQEKVVTRIRDALPPNERWVATEKAHGCNFTVTVDRDPDTGDVRIRYGKRSGFLAPGEKFFNWRRVDERYRVNFAALFGAFPSAERVVIYGELFGGVYGTLTSHERPIQKEVHYTTAVEFMAFDVRCDETFLDCDELIAVCAAAGVPVIPISHEGTLDEMLALDPVFPSGIPALLGMPPLEPGVPNLAEGWVLRPARTVFVNYGHHVARALLKRKNPAFLERAPAKIKKEKKETKAKLDPLANDPDLSGVISVAVSYVCEARLNNVVSKLGEGHKGIVGALVVDAFTDFRKEVPAEYRPEMDGRIKAALAAEAKCLNSLREVSAKWE